MKKGCCVHFSGIQNDECKSKINYRTLVGGEDWGWARKIPCLLKDNSTIICHKYMEPTEQQLEVYQKEVNKIVESINKVSPLIKKIKSENKNKDNSGTDICPECGNELSWSIASVNNHVWLKCKTKNCISMME